jgi:hypothetical protein
MPEPHSQELIAMRIDPASNFPRACIAGAARHVSLRAALLLLVLAAALGARDVSAQAPSRLYQVEVVVFSQPTGSSVERPPRQRVPADGILAEGALGPQRDESAATEAGTGTELAALDPALSLLPEGFSVPQLPLVLEPVARRLNTGGYRLLWHQAWVQSPMTREGPELALLAALGQGPVTPGLEGTISLVAGRFLHLGLDLVLHSQAGREAELRQRRRLRPTIQQYFDHPRIGVVAVVRPVETEPDHSIP